MLLGCILGLIIHMKMLKNSMFNKKIMLIVVGFRFVCFFIGILNECRIALLALIAISHKGLDHAKVQLLSKIMSL